MKRTITYILGFVVSDNQVQKRRKYYFFRFSQVALGKVINKQAGVSRNKYGVILKFIIFIFITREVCSDHSTYPPSSAEFARSILSLKKFSLVKKKLKQNSESFTRQFQDDSNSATEVQTKYI